MSGCRTLPDHIDGDKLAEVIEDYLYQATRQPSSTTSEAIARSRLRTAVHHYRHGVPPTGRILGDRAESLPTTAPPPTSTEGGPHTSIPALAELIAAAVEMRWNVAEGQQVGTDVIIEHASWIRFRRALRRITNPEEYGA